MVGGAVESQLADCMAGREGGLNSTADSITSTDIYNYSTTTMAVENQTATYFWSTTLANNETTTTASDTGFLTPTVLCKMEIATTLTLLVGIFQVGF